jgi:hypothetical protein
MEFRDKDGLREMQCVSLLILRFLLVNLSLWELKTATLAQPTTRHRMSAIAPETASSDPRTLALGNYRKKLLEHRELEAKVKQRIYC